MKPSVSTTWSILARSSPSTRTLILPSGSFRLWTMLTTVPTWKISWGLGSSMLASCCVARKIFLSPASASSNARTLDSRPTTNGVIIEGKMTTSRIGIMGSFLVSNFSRWVTKTALSFGLAQSVPSPKIDIAAAHLPRRARAALISSRITCCEPLYGRLVGGLGSREACAPSSLARLLHDRHAHVALLDHVGRDFEFLQAPLAGEVVHEVEHQLFQDHAQPACANLARHRFLGDKA